MQTRSIVSTFALAVMMSGVVVAKTTSDYDRNADFSAYKTYSWAPSTNSPKDPLWTQRIIDGIDHQLSAKGLARGEGSTDLLVAAYGNVYQTHSLQGFGGAGRFVNGSFSVEQVTKETGSLTVALYDSKSKRMVWRGIVTEDLSEKPEKNLSRLEKDLERLFKKYPGEPAK